jgi:hypothetical protein
MRAHEVFYSCFLPPSILPSSRSVKQLNSYYRICHTSCLVRFGCAKTYLIPCIGKIEDYPRSRGSEAILVVAAKDENASQRKSIASIKSDWDWHEYLE